MSITPLHLRSARIIPQAFFTDAADSGTLTTASSPSFHICATVCPVGA